MQFEHIVYEKVNGVAKITIHRPDVLNAMNAQTNEELSRALKNGDEDEEVRVVIITGTGKAFSAGADIKAMQAGQWGSKAAHRELVIKTRGYIEFMKKPVIAAINGYCLGGGLELALCCDFRIASDSAIIGLTEVNIGMIPGGGGTQRLPRLIGVSKAKRVIMLGERIPASEAEALGIIDKTVASDQLEKEVAALAEKLKEKAPLALAYAKASINQVLRTSLEDGLQYEAHFSRLCTESEDWQEGMKAFAEKRKPIWKGK